jgi:hypothetical protein
MDHAESLQVMRKNYDSMVTELEKLRAELTNTANRDKSGMSSLVISFYYCVD